MVKKIAANTNNPQKYADLFLPIEDHWMEKNVINTFVINDGGRVVDVHFRIRFADSGKDFFVVLDLTVSGINKLSAEAHGNILNEIEWAMDEIKDTEFSEYDLDVDHYINEEINLIVEEDM